MKIMLARDVFVGTNDATAGIPAPQSLSKFDDAHLLHQTSSSSIESLRDLSSLISMEELHRAVDYLESATFIHSFGIGLSSGIAFDFAHKMQRLGLLCGYYQETQMQMISASNMRSGMVGVIISHSGNTTEMVKAAKNLRDNGVKVLTITGNKHGDIAFLSDVVLLGPLSEPLKRQGASSSRIAQLVIIDMLFSLIINKAPEKYSQIIKRTYSAYE